jgi:hypothetical protein
MVRQTYSMRLICSSERRNTYRVGTLSKGLYQKRGLSSRNPGKEARHCIPLFIYFKVAGFIYARLYHEAGIDYAREYQKAGIEMPLSQAIIAPAIKQLSHAA